MFRLYFICAILILNAAMGFSFSITTRNALKRQSFHSKRLYSSEFARDEPVKMPDATPPPTPAPTPDDPQEEENEAEAPVKPASKYGDEEEYGSQISSSMKDRLRRELESQVTKELTRVH